MGITLMTIKCTVRLQASKVIFYIASFMLMSSLVHADSPHDWDYQKPTLLFSTKLQSRDFCNIRLEGGTNSQYINFDNGELDTNRSVRTMGFGCAKRITDNFLFGFQLAPPMAFVFFPTSLNLNFQYDILKGQNFKLSALGLSEVLISRPRYGIGLMGSLSFYVYNKEVSLFIIQQQMTELKRYRQVKSVNLSYDITTIEADIEQDFTIIGTEFSLSHIFPLMLKNQAKKGNGDSVISLGYGVNTPSVKEITYSDHPDTNYRISTGNWYLLELKFYY